jgi:hypothetical protein
VKHVAEFTSRWRFTLVYLAIAAAVFVLLAHSKGSL